MENRVYLEEAKCLSFQALFRACQTEILKKCYEAQRKTWFFVHFGLNACSILINISAVTAL